MWGEGHRGHGGVQGARGHGGGGTRDTGEWGAPRASLWPSGGHSGRRAGRPPRWAVGRDTMAPFLTSFRTESSKYFGPVECGEAHERAIRCLYREGVIAQCGNRESLSTGSARKDLEQQLPDQRGQRPRTGKQCPSDRWTERAVTRRKDGPCGELWAPRRAPSAPRIRDTAEFSRGRTGP